MTTAVLEEVSADAITSCTRTKSNKLSLWKVDDKDNPKDAVLPLITGFEKPNRCEIVYIDENLLQSAGIELVKEKGITPLKELEDTHYDAVVHNYAGLGKFAEIILTSLKDKTNFAKVKDNDVKKLIMQLVESDRIKKEDLHEKMQEKLGYAVSIEQSDVC